MGCWWLLNWLRPRGGDVQSRRLRAAFAVRYREVLRACELLEEQTGAPPAALARRYMSGVLRAQRDEGWWEEHSPYLAEAWYIYEYACESGLLQRAEPGAEAIPELYVIEPAQTAQEECVRIRVCRQAGRPDCGEVILECSPANEGFRRMVGRWRYAPAGEGFARTIREVDGAIGDRTVEAATALLAQGYRVCVDEPALRERILAGEYEPEYPYWVLEGSRADLLELRYPWDKQLHGYVCRAGGRWNGRVVELSICSAHRLDDVLRLYGFRITEGARARMDAWRRMIDSATIYQPRRKKNAGGETLLVDRFREMIEHRENRIDDLYEDDE